ncbi:MAG: lysine--tRNA ligase [Candidatus Diapherotrites archaeon]
MKDLITDEEIKKLGFDESKLKKLREILAKGINPYAYSFKETTKIKDILKKYDKITHEKTKEKLRVAGRLYTIRYHGKAIFADIRDSDEKIQLYLREDEIGKDKYSFFRNFIDVGDIIGVEGHVFRTKLGEITIWATSYELLAKSLIVMPEKFHGLQDIERRYRERYLDLICNQETREVFKIRTKILYLMRKYLISKGFLEVETPILQPLYGGANAKPFETYHNFLKQKLYLRIAPELYLKRLVVGGFDKVFEIAKNFRNESIDTLHNPEFTMIEIYEAYKDYADMIELTEDMLSYIVKETIGSYKVKFFENEIDFKPKWKVATMCDLIESNIGIDVTGKELAELKKLAEKKGIRDAKNLNNRGEIIVALFENFVEDTLIQPTFVTEFPVEVSPLAKESRTKKGFSERFELFINGWEIANGFSELNDPINQKVRFEEQIASKKETPKVLDYDYIKALGYGLPPTGGVGIGIDRFTMLLTNKNSIKEVILFPHMRPSE